MNAKLIRSSRKFSLLLVAALVPFQGNAHTLTEAIQKALGTNPEVLSAKAALKVSEEQLISAKAGYLPTVDLSMQAGEENMRKPASAKTEMWQQDHNITLKQSLFDGGSTDSTVERSEQMLSNAQTRVEDLTSSISLNVIESWYELYRLQKVAQLTQKNVTMHKRVFDQIQQKVKAGAAGKAELTAAETPYILALTSQASNKGQLSDALARYFKVVGERPEGMLPNPESLLADAVLPENVDALVEQVLAVAPGVRTAEANLLAAEADFRGAKAGLLPTVDFEFKELMKNDAAGTDGTEYGWTALLKLNYNLYSGGADMARERETAEAKIDSREQLNLARRTAEEQARIGWSGLMVSNQILRLNQQQMKTATETLKSTNEQFKLGEADVMAVMGSEDGLFQAQQSVLQERITGTIARYRLLNQLGLLKLDGASVGAEESESSSAEADAAAEVESADRVVEKMGEAVSEAQKSAPVAAPEAAPVIEKEAAVEEKAASLQSSLVDVIEEPQSVEVADVRTPSLLEQMADQVSQTLAKVELPSLPNTSVEHAETPSLAVEHSAENSTGNAAWDAAYQSMREAGWVR